MISCTVTIDPAFVIAPVPSRLFGSFVEHMGRCVYGGVYDPGHEQANDQGLRKDVLDLVRELGISVVRYPGGNFVSSYNWEDGVGPVDERPVRLDLAWRSIEPNTFGLGEFMDWARLAQIEPMMSVNLGLRGVADAVNLLEYTNFPGGTKYSDLRISHGQTRPYGIRLWCLGNEMDGPWQIGHKSADAYGVLADETAKAMRQVDPNVELVLCGSSNSHMPTYGSWEATVLEHAYEHVDYISLHAYFEQSGDDRTGFLGSACVMDDFINGVVATCDHVAAKNHIRRKMILSFDEWNIWNESRFVGQTNLEWAKAPRLIEDEYTTEDAVVVGNLLMSLLRHSDRVGIACLAQLVNVIAPIRAEARGMAWRQSIFYPFALTAQNARGDVLRVEPKTDLIHSPNIGDIPVVDVVATHDNQTDEITIFTVNRHQEEEVILELQLITGEHYEIAEQFVLGGQDLLQTNNQQAPQRVKPRASKTAILREDGVMVKLPPVSWTMLRLISHTGESCKIKQEVD